jgi:hypothetical protein
MRILILMLYHFPLFCFFCLDFLLRALWFFQTFQAVYTSTRLSICRFFIQSTSRSDSQNIFFFILSIILGLEPCLSLWLCVGLSAFGSRTFSLILISPALPEESGPFAYQGVGLLSNNGPAPVYW